ncbi:MAG: penicillin-binding protein, partial [Actinobacteria bacterium]|nr:penicillin-binding protein [Actinomycetota bacterium]
MPEQRPSFRPLAPWQALLALPLVIALAATTLGVLSLPALATADAAVGSVRDELLDIPPLPEVADPAERSRMYDSGGNFMGFLVGAENRDIVPLDRIPEHVRQAVIATEDDTFYEHNGVNRAAVMRAMMANVQSGDIQQGASTITQQYVKNAMLSNAQTLERKLQEAIYATRLERELSKDEILERYLNIAYFGSGAYGVAAAAERYFGIGVENVSLDQAAMLAGMIRLPEVNNPIRSPENAIARRNVVLRQMRIAGFITPEEEERAKQAGFDPSKVTEPEPPPHPFFVEYIKKILLDHPALGETREERINAVFGGGLRIHTTLDQRMQTL